MKKKILNMIALSFIVFVFFAGNVSAQIDTTGPVTKDSAAFEAGIKEAQNAAGTLPEVGIGNPLGKDIGIEMLIQRSILGLLGFCGVLALVVFIYGGVFWLISMGDTNKVAKGKNAMIWAIFGLAVIFGSYAIITAIYKLMGVS